MSSFPDFRVEKATTCFHAHGKTGTNNYLREVNNRSGSRFGALFGICSGTLPTLTHLIILVTQQRCLGEVHVQELTVYSHQLINHPNDCQFR
jgi:hypothetical protein